MALRRGGVLPGFPLTLGVTLGYLTVLVLIPLCVLALKAGTLPWSKIGDLVGERTLSAYGLSVGAALLAGLIDSVLGLVVAWVLVRYRFFGRALLDSLVDLPFA